MAKSTVEKQAEFGKKIGWSNFILKCVKTRNDSHNEFLGCYFPGQEKFILIDSKASLYIYGEK